MKNLLPFENNTVPNLLANMAVVTVVGFIAISVLALTINTIINPEAFNSLR